MGIFDVFNTSDQTAAANAQIAGINSGVGQATGNINSAISGNNTSYTAALQPYLANYAQSQQGTTALGNVLGLNGAAGNQSASQALQSTPGYQFQLGQGNAAINAAAAANGTLNSGNQNIALANYNQGLAGTTYNNYVSQLQPFLGASNAAAGGIAGVNTGQANANASQYDTLANLNYTAQTGIGNANANADLAGLTASGNSINALMQGAKLATSIFSDARLKEDIAKVGELYDGTNVYSYRYKGSDVPQIGLMAQEVEKTNPDAVTEIGGFKAVHYGKATKYAADLAAFMDAPERSSNVVDFPTKPESTGYAGDLSRFLEAA